MAAIENETGQPTSVWVSSSKRLNVYYIILILVSLFVCVALSLSKIVRAHFSVRTKCFKPTLNIITPNQFNLLPHINKMLYTHVVVIFQWNYLLIQNWRLKDTFSIDDENKESRKSKRAHWKTNRQSNKIASEFRVTISLKYTTKW